MNSRFLPPDIPPPKAGGGGGSLFSKKVRPQNSTNPIPFSRDFSLLTALVGAMIINESERHLHQQQESSFSTFLQNLFSKVVSSDSSTHPCCPCQRPGPESGHPAGRLQPHFELAAGSSRRGGHDCVVAL
jgi:hypothetical protein